MKRHKTKTKCPTCGGDLTFHHYGMVDTDGIWHSDYPDWYRCRKCKSWEFAYTSTNEV